MRNIATLLSAALLAAASVGITAGPADAAGPASEPVETLSCSHSHPDVTKSPYDRLFASNYVNIRSGPHLSCNAVAQDQMSHRVDIHCYVTTDTIWVYLRDVTTGYSGWVRSDQLNPFWAIRC